MISPGIQPSHFPWIKLYFQRTTPNITIEINDKRSNRQKRLEFNFMSPVVLRKEIDNLIAEDEDIMRYPQFIDNHETQFWNLLYGLFTFHFDFFRLRILTIPLTIVKMARKWDLTKIYEILYFYSSDGSLKSFFSISKDKSET